MSRRYIRLGLAYFLFLLLVSISATQVFASSFSTYPTYSGTPEPYPSQAGGCATPDYGEVCSIAVVSNGNSSQESYTTQPPCMDCSGNDDLGTYVYYLNPIGTYGNALSESGSPSDIYLAIAIDASGVLDSNTDGGSYNAEAAFGYNLNYSYPGGSTLYVVTIQYSHDAGTVYYLTECGLSDPSPCLFYFSVAGSGSGTYLESGGPFTGVTASYDDLGTGSATANFWTNSSPYYYQITVDYYELSDTVP